MKKSAPEPGLMSGDPGALFKGRIGKTFADSEPWWPTPARAPDGAPNIVMILLDDLGYSDFGAFGSEIATPNIDRLAHHGLRFDHYTTVPMCTPARAAFLTGKNPHAVGCGWLTHGDPGYPGYGGEISPDAPTVAELLREQGYSSMAIGKWHNTKEHNASAAGDRRSWPVQRGFDQFYGFIASETSYFYPDCLYEGSQALNIDSYPADYFATDDWTDRGIRFVKDHLGSGPNKPFFLYMAYNAPHMPIQARPEDIRKYRGHYDAGWDVLREARFRKQIAEGLFDKDTRLPPRNPGIPAWEQLPAGQRELFPLYMEVYAALVENLDRNIGRLVSFLEQAGVVDNTLIMVASDNGASAMGGDDGTVNGWQRRLGGTEDAAQIRALIAEGGFGGPDTYIAYPRGWAQVSNTPFRYFKRTPMNGGIRVPFIAHWPKVIKDPGAIRRQWMHVTDILPTLLDVVGVPYPAAFGGYRTRELDGMSFAEALRNPEAPVRRTRQHYELDGNRGYIKDGWKIVSLQPPAKAINLANWMLYDLGTDPTEVNDLAATRPDKLKELVEAFEQDAAANYVYPIDNREYDKSLTVPPYRLAVINQPHVFYQGAQTAERVSVFQLFADRSFRITARFDFQPGAQGVIYVIGGAFGGLVAYVIEGALYFIYQRWPMPLELAPIPLESGTVEMVFDYEALGKRQGQGRILVNGREWVPRTPMSPSLGRLPSEGIDVGIDRRQPATHHYAKFGTFKYSHTIEGVRVEPGPQAPGSLINMPEDLAQRHAVASVRPPGA